MAVQDIDKLIAQNPRLASLPDVVGELNSAVESPYTSTGDLADIIGRDPALSARLLAVVNSPHYGLPRQVSSLDKAVALIGTNQLRFLAISTVVVNRFSDMPNALVTMDTFWRHSFTCAVAARTLAEHLGERDRESHFLAGLLHDIGSLLLYTTLPTLSKEAILYARKKNLPVFRAERDVIGFDHAEAGATLLRHWNLPEDVVAAVGGHHEIGAQGHHGQKKAIIHLANGIATAIHPSTPLFKEPQHVDPDAWRLAGVSETQLDAVLGEIDQRVAEAMGVLYYAA